MSKIKILLFLLLLIVSLFSQEDNISLEDIELQEEESLRELFTTTPTVDKDQDNEFRDQNSDEDIDIAHLKQKYLFPSYDKTPKKVYVNEVFPIKINLILGVKNRKITTNFINGKNYKILNPNSKWIQKDDNSFENTFYFKLKSKESILPDIKISANITKSFIDSEILKKLDIDIIPLKKSELFSSVLAENLIVTNFKASKYDEHKNTVYLEIEATRSNLEDFNLSWVISNSIDIKNTKNVYEQKISYIATIHNSIRTFKFEYFDLKTNKIILLSFPIVVSDERLSTQIGLNPKESKYVLYKTIALIIFAFILILIYLKTKKIIYVIISILVLIYVAYEQVPVKNIAIKKGVSVTILPTKNSTVFYKTNRVLEAEILNERDNYIKVLLPNKKIGWIKVEDIQKN